MGAAQKNPQLLSIAAPESLLNEAAGAAGWSVFTCNNLEDVPADVAAEAVAVIELGAGVTADQDLRAQFPHALFVALQSTAQADLVIERSHQGLFAPLIEHAAKHWQRGVKMTALAQEVGMRRQRMHQLNEISLALTTQMDQSELLHTILSEACRIAHCEGGSVFLVAPDRKHGESLVFKLAENDAVDFPFVETRLPMTAESIAGYVAVTGQELNIQDVYTLSEALPYKFNRSFDDKMNYRTRSVLALPMRDHRDRVVGVLQFINQKNSRNEVISFGEEAVEILRAIASQAAVSVQKNGLLQDINQLFESFVQASVKTIEQRDPSTSGHSFRVAETTVALLQALPQSGVARFRYLEFSQQDIREVRYAALLHDFGKIGVPEAILVKANKLTDERLEVLRYRFELQKERLRSQALEQQLELLHHNPMDHEVALRRVHRQLEKQLSVLDQYFDWVQRASSPNVLDAGEYDHLAEIRDYAFRELDGSVGGVINDDDLLALSVRRGSLTPAERRAIESHVVFTKEFLSVLPWPPELSEVPEIAGGHHERLDGSGYPAGLVAEEIPLASRVMAVCDVYDALTAMDRPYKPAMGEDAAFSILQDEARRGLLEQEMVNIFIASGSYQLAEVS